MSTRCQTFITEGGEPVATIYRHCDGYPEGMGIDLCQMCADLKRYNWGAADVLVKRILTSEDFDAEIEAIRAKHGDTEYEYYIDFPSWGCKDEPLITVKDLWRGKTVSGTPSEVMQKIKDESCTASS